LNLKQLFYRLLLLICILGTGGKILFAQNSDSLYISPNNTSTPKQVTINNIFIVGNEKTRKNIILREMNLAENMTYNWEEFVALVTADQKKIYNLRLFTTATVTPLFVGEEQVEILVSVKERWYILPSIIFNLADRNFSEWWSNQNRDFSRVNYGIKLDHNNIGGRNEKLRVIGQVGFTQAILLNYTIPYFDKNQLHGLAAKFSYNTNKNIPIKSVGNKQYFYRNPDEDILKKTLAASLTYSFRGSFYNFHYFTAGYHNTWIHKDVIQEKPNYFTHDDQKLKYFLASYRYRHDNRDNVSYATHGTMLDASLTKYGMFGNDDIDELEFSIMASKYNKLGDKFHFATGISGSAFFSDNQPYTLVRGIGYKPDFIRGYELNVIEGQQLIAHKNSLRYEILDIAYDISDIMPIDEFSVFPIKLYLSGNFDHGYVRDANRLPLNAALINKYLLGYGLGLDLIGMYDAVFRFEYSVNNMGTGSFFVNVKAPI
tara:strand:- start:25875 stop:27332 length:1458 start_codon:yes stop_codon:yes gene_type:complete